MRLKCTGNASVSDPCSAEFLRNLTTIIVHLKVSKKSQKLFDHRLDLCAFVKNPRFGVVVSLFKKFYLRIYNNKLLTCPILKGNYSLTNPEEEFSEVDFDMPAVFPKVGILNFSFILKTKIAKKLRAFYTSSSDFELY
jgi:hypothetical protein